MTVRRNPSGRPADTPEHVWRHQMDAIRSRSVPQRLEEWRQLNEAGAVMEESSVRMRHPDYDDREVFLGLVVARYGPELAGEVWPESVGIEP
ncbi:MAG: hypothetical protein OXH86_19000 [Acidimicrobiaceae bacterium]|nr:hypothetical protein [Acidimicrobiaceae bacterium]